MAGLTPKQAAFVREYLIDLNATQAAIRAGYSRRGANVTGSQLLANPNIAATVEAEMQKRAGRVEVKADDVLRELLRVGLCDIGKAFGPDGQLLPLKDMPEDVRRAIAGIEVDELWGGHGDDRAQIGHTRKVKFWSKPQALDLLGKHLKLFTDKVEMEHAFASWTDEQLQKRRSEWLAEYAASVSATQPPEGGS